METKKVKWDYLMLIPTVVCFIVGVVTTIIGWFWLIGLPMFGLTAITFFLFITNGKTPIKDEATE